MIKRATASRHIQKIHDIIRLITDDKKSVIIRTKNGGVKKAYIKGYADAQCTIVLLTDQYHNINRQVLEIKEIEAIELLHP